MIISDEKLNKIIKEKQELIRRIDDNKYEKEQQKIEDINKLGKINMEITRMTMNLIKKSLNNENKTIKPINKETYDYKKLRKIIKERYEEYLRINRMLREMINESINKKREGRALYEELKNNKEKINTELISKILKY